MTHLSSLVPIVLATVLALGCDSASDEQTRASRAQAEANKTTVATAAVAEEKIKTAKAEADKKIAQAQANFQTMREDFRHNTTVALVEVDKSIELLEKKWKTQTGKAKTETADRLKQIRTDREALTTSYRALEAESAATWDQSKMRLEKAMQELKERMSKA